MIAKLTQLEAEADSLRMDLETLEAAESPAPLEITTDIDAMIQAAAQDIENLICTRAVPTHPSFARRFAA